MLPPNKNVGLKFTVDSYALYAHMPLKKVAENTEIFYDERQKKVKENRPPARVDNIPVPSIAGSHRKSTTSNIGTKLRDLVTQGL